MGIVFRQSVKSSIATFIGALLGALVIYLSTYFLPKQEFGFRLTLTNYASVAAHILLFGVQNMIAVYVHRYDFKDRRIAALMSISFILPFIFIAAASLAYFIFDTQFVHLFQPEDIPFVKEFFFWLPLFTLLFAYEVLLETYLIAMQKVAKATFVRDVLLRILNIALILMYGFQWISFAVLIYLTVLIYLIPIGIFLYYSRDTEPFRFSLQWNVFQKKEKKEIVHFTWYHSLLSVSIILLGMIDPMMLATLSKNGLKSVPVYTIALFILSFLMIPYRAMVTSTFAVLAQAFKKNSHSEISDIFTRSSLNIFIAALGMFLLIVCNMHNAVAVLPAGYENLTPIVFILSIGKMADMATGMNDQVLSLSPYYKYNFYISAMLVILLIGLNWWLIPLYDIFGAAWASTLALTVYNLSKFYIVKSKLGIQPFSVNTSKVIAAGIFSFLIGFFLPKISNPFLDTACRGLLIAISYAGLLLWLRPSEDLNHYLRTVKKNKRLF